MANQLVVIIAPSVVLAFPTADVANWFDFTGAGQ